MIVITKGVVINNNRFFDVVIGRDEFSILLPKNHKDMVISKVYGYGFASTEDKKVITEAFNQFIKDDKNN